MTALTDRRIEELRPPEAPRRGRLLPVAVVILTLAVMALGAWIIYDATRSPSSALTPEIEQLLDDYLLAWENQDASALRATVTEDYLLNEYIYEVGEDGVSMVERVEDDVRGVITLGFLFEWQTEQVGEAIVTGDGPWFVSVGENWVTPKGWFFTRYDGMASYVIVDDGGTLKIANHSWAGLRYDTE